MAKGKKTGGRDIRPGEILNPRGPETLDPVVKQIRFESRETVAKLYWDIVNMREFELTIKLQDPGITIFERCILKAIEVDIQEGRFFVIERLMERTLGKPKEHVKLSGSVDAGAKLDLSKLTLEELKLFKKLYATAKVGDGA